MIRPRVATEPQHRLKLLVAYDGRGFSGSQRQPGKRTVQGELESAAARLFGMSVPVSLAGRTDSGVHALGQVASCLDSRPELGESRIAHAMRSNCGDDLSVVAVERVHLGFDPRRDAKWRQYRYSIWNGPPNPILRGSAALVDRELNLEALRVGARSLVGEQDFASFAGLGQGVPWSGQSGRGSIRRIWSVEVIDHFCGWGRLVTIDVIGDAFLPGQVRSMIGALIEVGRGRKPPDWLTELVAQRDRRAGPKAAPAHGLALWRVGYEPFAGGSGVASPSR